MNRTKQRCGTDDIKVNVNDGSELIYWSIKFGVSKEDVRRIVKEVGDSPTAVQRKIKLTQNA